MTKEDGNILDYIVVCVSEFADRYDMHMKDAYIYLKQYKGLAFLKDFYDVEHTLSFDDVLDDLTVLCRKNGGAIQYTFHTERALKYLKKAGVMRDEEAAGND